MLLFRQKETEDKKFKTVHWPTARDIMLGNIPPSQDFLQERPDWPEETKAEEEENDVGREEKLSDAFKQNTDVIAVRVNL